MSENCGSFRQANTRSRSYEKLPGPQKLEVFLRIFKYFLRHSLRYCCTTGLFYIHMWRCHEWQNTLFFPTVRKEQTKPIIRYHSLCIANPLQAIWLIFLTRPMSQRYALPLLAYGSSVNPLTLGYFLEKRKRNHWCIVVLHQPNVSMFVHSPNVSLGPSLLLFVAGTLTVHSI